MSQLFPHDLFRRVVQRASALPVYPAEEKNAKPYEKTQQKQSYMGGNILVGSPGKGVILKSPNGATCKLLAIDNTGAMALSVIACP